MTAAEPSYEHGTGPVPLIGDTIGRNLDRAIDAFFDREAMVDVPSGRRWTYEEFGRAVDEVAMGLAFSLVPAVLAVVSIAALRRYEEPEVGRDRRR